ncbi:MAG: hypothetical protein LAO79_09430 [Acidobacteriia bacterium]|nr:hypothetical protein [Terriglobia bacterium]
MNFSFRSTIHVSLALLAARSAVAQERPLQITGTFSTGYYSATSRGDATQDVQFVPFGAKFDMSGYFISPDLLSFSVQPELNVGPQASEAGFEGGNGISMRLVFLRKQAFPFTFRYSNVQVADVYFGSLTQVSAYTLSNRTRDLGFTWELKPRWLPYTTIDWGQGSVDAKSDIALVPDYLSSMHHLNIDSRYTHWGWNFDGFAHWQDVQADLFAPLNNGTNTSSLQQNVTQYQASGQRTIGRDSEIYFTAGQQSTASQLFDIPINLSTQIANAHLRLFQRRRWKTSLRANYASNLANQLLNQVIGGLSNAPGSIAPVTTVLTPLQQRISNLDLNAVTSVDLSHGVSLFGSVDRNSVLAASFETPISASYFTTSAGVTYAGSWGATRVSGQYSRDFGEGSVTGQTGRIDGQSYMFTAQRGSPDKLQLEGSVHGTDQSVRNVLPSSTSSFGVEGSIGHNVTGSWRARVGGGYQWGVFQNAGNEFRSNGFTARLGVEHPRVQINGSISDSFGNSLPVYSQYVIYNPVAGALFSDIPTIPSDFRAATFTVHTNPVRKLELSAVWTRSLQHLEGILNNDFQMITIYGTYHYRRVQLESGYIRSNQVFLNYPDARRGRFYVRVSRTARIL